MIKRRPLEFRPLTNPRDCAEDPKLVEHAEAIRELGKRTIAGIVEIGRRLRKAKQLVGHGHWGTWLKREFGWSADCALDYMRTAEFSENFKSRTFRDLKISLSALYLLAKKSTPEAVRTAIIERAEAGEHITAKDVKRVFPTTSRVEVVNTTYVSSKPITTLITPKLVFEPAEPAPVDTKGQLILLAGKVIDAVNDAGTLTDFDPGLVKTLRQAAAALTKLADDLDQRLEREREPHTVDKPTKH